MNRFFQKVVMDEILPTLSALGPQTEQFAKDVLDRFANPSIEHKLLSITFQTSSKMNARNVQTILRYQEAKGMLPESMLLGFAATILFLKPAKESNGKYQGERNGELYDINDDNAAAFAQHWSGVNTSDYASVAAMVKAVCSDRKLWETDLGQLSGFTDTVTDHLVGMLQHGVKAYVQHSKVL